jgi:hypothetical protein
MALQSSHSLLCYIRKPGAGNLRKTGRFISRGMVNTENHCGNDGQWRHYVRNARMIHLRGQIGAIIGRGQHPKRRKTIMHGMNSGILRALFCVLGGIYRPEFLKLNLTMTARHDPDNDRGVGVSVLTNLLRQNRAHRGPWTGLCRKLLACFTRCNLPFELSILPVIPGILGVTTIYLAYSSIYSYIPDIYKYVPGITGFFFIWQPIIGRWALP